MGDTHETARLAEKETRVPEPDVCERIEGNVCEEADVADGSHLDGDGAPIENATEALAALQCCSVVVALHPDQAAEHAIALALALRKPFAVVPCCVYSAEFPKRRLPNGAHVRTYEDLLSYLQGLSPYIRRQDLDFEGKRTLLFMTVADVLASRS